MAGLCDEDCVFPLGRGFLVDCAGSPVIGFVDDGIFFAGVYHRFNRKNHARGKGNVN